MSDLLMRNGLGRLPSADERDRMFSLAPIMPLLRQSHPVRTSKTWWDQGWIGDQAGTPHSVGYSWIHWIEDGPVTHAPKRPGAPPLLTPAELYDEAQKLDEWPGEDYEGTSVRAGAKALQALGMISEYWWAFDLSTLVDAVLYAGPVVVGTNWYEGMFNANNDNHFTLPLTGEIVGGHAYVLNGVDSKNGFFRMKNSWGPMWGRKGHALINFDDMDRLLKEDGEACIAVERTDPLPAR